MKTMAAASLLLFAGLGYATPISSAIPVTGQGTWGQDRSLPAGTGIFSGISPDGRSISVTGGETRMTTTGFSLNFPASCIIDGINFGSYCGGSFDGTSGVVNGYATNFTTILATETISGLYISNIGQVPCPLFSCDGTWSIGPLAAAIENPEPATWSLMALGLLGVWIARREKIGKA